MPFEFIMLSVEGGTEKEVLRELRKMNEVR